MSEHRHLFKNAGVVSFFTLASRILGFVRDIVIARMFGTETAAQAFVVAFRIPNMLRDLIGEGAANAAIIPVLSEYQSPRDSDTFRRLVRTLVVVAGVLLTVLTVLGVALAPWLVRVTAYGFTRDAEKFALTVVLTRMLFPFVLLIGLAALAMGVLNTRRHFATPAAGPCLLNISMIVAGIWFCPRMPEPVIGMAIAVLIGGFFQLAIMLPPLRSAVFSFPAGYLSWRHPAVLKIGRLLLPRMVGSSIYQCSIIVDTFFASLSHLVGDGAVAALYFANRLISFPGALFGTAVATAALPLLSRQAVANDMPRLKETLRLTARTLLLLLIPCAVGLFVLSGPIVAVLLQRGKFDAAAAAMTARALSVYCLGLVAFSCARLVTSCFFALRDTVTPLRITAFSLLINIFCNIVFVRPLQIAGPPLATSISASVNVVLLLIVLRRKIGPLGMRPLFYDTVRIVALSLFMGVICARLFAAASLRFVPAAALALAMSGGIAVFLLGAWRWGFLAAIGTKR